MIGRTNVAASGIAVLLLALSTTLLAQQPPYDVFPPADPPYYRVRYEALTQPGELIFPVNYTIWIPQGVKTLRGVIVHQHGCGEGSCKSGLTGAYDLHWQALAKKHDCALLSPTYEQPEKADCQMWCDPRNGSSAAFQKCLVDLGAKSGHPELAEVPWALWGHSGGGHWAGGMVLLHPERVAAAWLRSGVPLLIADPAKTTIKAHTLPDASLKVPVMCNLGTQEGVTVKDNRFAAVWPANEAFFNEVRARGGLISVAVDPLSAHECGNQRYFAIPWLDACLSARLPKAGTGPLNDMPTDTPWLAPITGNEAVPAAKFVGDPLKAAWLPNEAVAKAWMQYVKDTAVTDTTPPPAPTNVRLSGNVLNWEADADVESGLASFLIERDGQFLANVPEQGKNPFGRPLFQNLQYSDTPTQPLVPLQFTDTKAAPNQKHTYRVIAVNTVGLKSQASTDSVAGGADVLTIEGVAGLGKGQHIVFVTGEEYYRSEEGMSMFAKIMARHHGFRCTVLFAIDPASGQINPNRNNHIPGLAALETADLMVIFARFRELPDADMKHIVDYVNAGKPVLGIRNATHAFRYSPHSTSPYKSWDWQSKEWPGGFGQQILGDTWIAHYGQFQKEATMAHVNTTQCNHPVLRGVAETIFCHTDVNSVERLTPGDVVLFHGQVLSGLQPTDPPVTDNRKDVRMPFAWFKTYTAPSGKQGQSFTTTAGASLDWQSEDLRRLMVNAMLSLTGHEQEIPAKTNVAFVDAYNPKPTGAIPDAVWAATKLTPASFATPTKAE